MSGVTEDKKTLLHIAAKNRNVEIIKLLLKANAEISKRSSGYYSSYCSANPISLDKETAPETAVGTKNLSVISAFLDNANIEPAIASYMLEKAVSMRSMEIVKFLFEHFKKFEFGSRAVYISMLNGDTEIFLFLLRKGYSLLWNNQAKSKTPEDFKKIVGDGKQYLKNHSLPENYNTIFIISLIGNWDMEQNPNIYKSIKLAVEQNLFYEAITKTMIRKSIESNNVPILIFLLENTQSEQKVPIGKWALRQSTEDLLIMMKHASGAKHKKRIAFKLIERNCAEGLKILDSWGHFDKWNVQKYMNIASNNGKPHAYFALQEIFERITEV